jgi:CubicO group peptidase (beta-lactamase class C family)
MLCGCIKPTAQQVSTYTPPVGLADGIYITKNYNRLDTAVLSKLHQQIASGTYGTINSVLIAQDNELIYEHYFNKFRREQLHTLQSATKSINSLLIGILIDQGKIKSVNEKVANFFPEYPFTDSLQKSITIEHLLTMTSGVAWNEETIDLKKREENDNLNMNDSKDYIQYFFSKPMDTPPGQNFVYNSGCSIVLGGIVERASGQTIEQFANQYLFSPLSISRYKWNGKSKKGQYHTGGGLHLSSRDLLKIGLLLENGGIWQGKRILSQKWIEQSFIAPYLTNRRNGFEEVYFYGYQWWKLKVKDKVDVISARGWGGQRLFMVPDLKIVIVIYSANFFDEPRQSIDHLLEQVLQSHHAYR